MQSNGSLLFYNDDGVHGAELWRSDGSQEGTVLVKDIRPGAAGSLAVPSENNVSAAFEAKRGGTFLDINGVAYFTADDGVHGRELWKSDGTAKGTVLVRDVMPGSGESNISHLRNVNGKLFFFAVAPDGRSQLWGSDGTTRRTLAIADVNVTDTAGSLFVGVNDRTGPTIAIVGNTLYFLRNFSDPRPDELWKSDGTSAGTRQVTLSQPLTLRSTSLGVVGGRLILFDNSTGDVWALNPTTASLARLANLPDDAAPIAAGEFGGRLFFTANVRAGLDSTSKKEQLWATDGTPAGTLLLRNGATGSGGSQLAFAASANQCYFPGPSGFGLWTSDGSVAGTRLVKNDGFNGSLRGFVNVNGTIYFSDDTALYRSDGTSAGTILVATLPRTGDLGSYVSGARSATAAGGRLYFLGADLLRDFELWAYNPDTSKKKLRRLQALEPQINSRKGRITVTGTRWYDDLRVTAVKRAGTLTITWNGFASKTYSLKDVASVHVTSGGKILLTGPVPHATLIGRSVTGGDGDDVLEGHYLNGGDGDDILVARSDLFFGASLDGGPGRDILRGGAGPDTLIGGGGDDQLYGGEGDDRLYGGDGDGGPDGNDLLSGGGGTDTADYRDRTENLSISLNGRADDGAKGERDNVQTDVENITGGEGDDRLSGSKASQTLLGGAGNDTIEGGRGKDSLYGDEGNDILIAGADDDTLIGGDGRDSLYGNDGDDYFADYDPTRDDIFGGAGYDWIDSRGIEEEVLN